jgi:hypothetical protein
VLLRNAIHMKESLDNVLEAATPLD